MKRKTLLLFAVSIVLIHILNAQNLPYTLLWRIAAVDDDDDVTPALTYLTRKVVNFNGSRARFFFYKISYSDDESQAKSLACAGPFDINAANISEKDTDGFIYSEDFSAENLQVQIFLRLPNRKQNLNNKVYKKFAA